MLSYRDFVHTFRELGIEEGRPVIAHASLSAFGEVKGGARSVVAALMDVFARVVVPTFTYKTMIKPDLGPPNNAMIYGSGQDQNRLAEIFRPDMRASPMMGIIAETLRRHSRAARSSHPIFSFAGVGAQDILDAQTIEEQIAPIRMLTEAGGWALQLGVDHTTNTSLHYAESLAGRMQFLRWALTEDAALECPRFNGCSDGFEAIAPQVEGITRTVALGPSRVRALPLPEMVAITQTWIENDPLALLCDRPDCMRCNAVRTDVATAG